MWLPTPRLTIDAGGISPRLDIVAQTLEHRALLMRNTRRHPVHVDELVRRIQL
jgi:hypothetical protein